MHCIPPVLQLQACCNATVHCSCKKCCCMKQCWVHICAHAQKECEPMLAMQPSLHGQALNCSQNSSWMPFCHSHMLNLVSCRIVMQDRFSFAILFYSFAFFPPAVFYF